MKTTAKLTHLPSQSNLKYNLMKDETNKLYYIKRLRDNKLALIGNRDEAEEFVLFGIDANKEELKTLIFI